MMSPKFKFILSTTLVLLIAGDISYKFVIPHLKVESMWCSSGGLRNYGCSTSSGTFITILVAIVAVLIAILWNKYGE